jgi:hypothetical protein
VITVKIAISTMRVTKSAKKSVMSPKGIPTIFTNPTLGEVHASTPGGVFWFYGSPTRVEMFAVIDAADRGNGRGSRRRRMRRMLRAKATGTC